MPLEVPTDATFTQHNDNNPFALSNKQQDYHTMMLRNILFILTSLLSLVAAQNKNVQMGMEGLLQTSQDPELMAQLFQDMQVRAVGSLKEMLLLPLVIL